MRKNLSFGRDHGGRRLVRAGASLLLAVCMMANLLLPLAGSVGMSAAKADAVTAKPLQGLTISIMGDSISTYDGWSNKYPIADESYTNRYGEPYYGLPGSDCHNEELLVSDTWWHQAAEELGLEVLMSNAGNSTGVLWAKYPAIPAWEQYLKDLLMYKSRPYYLGRDGKDPDIIALYVGSSDARQWKDYDYNYGAIEDINFDELIKKSGSGYTYAEPQTVAEAYSILLHKVSVTYPNAEVYCFAVVPQSSFANRVDIVNGRIPAVKAFNAMVYDVASYWGATVVDLFEGYGLDQDGDNKLTDAEYVDFYKCYNEDPHPNAAGFDKITEIFVNTVLENTRYLADVETTPGDMEAVTLSAQQKVENGVTTVTTKAENFVTPNDMTVNYEGEKVTQPNGELTAENSWTAENTQTKYKAEGGMDAELNKRVPGIELSVPLFDKDVPQTSKDETVASYEEEEKPEKVVSGDIKAKDDDGVYDYYETYNFNRASLRIKTKAIETQKGKAIIVPTEGMTHYFNATRPSDTNDMLMVTEIDLPTGQDDLPAFVDGYEYVFIGSDQYSKYSSAHAHTYRSEAWPNEEPVYVDEKEGYSLYVHLEDHSVFQGRKLTVPRLYFQNGTYKDFEENVPLRYDYVQNFTVVNHLGQIAMCYCADKDTPAQDGYGYNIFNVEDADYYSKEAAQMIRHIGRNGYWGTASGEGSLAHLKSKLLESGQFTQAEVDRLTDGMALTATQYAIWTFSNEMTGVKMLNTYLTSTTRNNGKIVPYMTKNTAVPVETTDLIFKVFWYLVHSYPVNPTALDMDTSNTIINEKNFLDDISVKLTAKADDARNRDSNPDNDVYLADISFKLKVKIADADNENIVMELANQNKTYTGRLAGTPRPGEVSLQKVNDTTYRFVNIPVQEGDVNVTFKMYGYQNLQNDAYLYLAETRDGETSQPLVGMAKGLRAFNQAMSLNFELEANEGEEMKLHVWRNETLPPPPPPTGDPSKLGLWLMLMAASSAMLVGMLWQQKKKKA